MKDGFKLYRKVTRRECESVLGRMNKQKIFPDLWKSENSQQTELGNFSTLKGFKENRFLFVQPPFGSAKIRDIKSFIWAFESVCEIANMSWRPFSEICIVAVFICQFGRCHLIKWVAHARHLPKAGWRGRKTSHFLWLQSHRVGGHQRSLMTSWGCLVSQHCGWKLVMKLLGCTSQGTVLNLRNHKKSHHSL